MFKVKQRGIDTLEKIRMSSIDPRTHNIEKLEYIKECKSSAYDETLIKEIADNTGFTPSIQFNWPYDYFSFVELIKLDTKIDSYNHK